MSIVGDAYTRPIVEELQRGDYDLSSFVALATGGAATNERYKEALVDLLPHVTIIDGYGASETGGMAFGTWTRRRRDRGRLRPRARCGGALGRPQPLSAAG